jgi:proline iminopeptidase
LIVAVEAAMRRKTMTIVFVSIGIVLVALAAATFALFSSFGKALYEPASLSRSVNTGKVALDPAGTIVYGLTREDGTKEFTLEAEPGITLAGFERGEGAPVLVVHGGPGFPPGGPWAGPSSFEGKRRFVYWHQRGSGLSTRPIDSFPTKNFPANVTELDRKLGMAAQIADIERIRRALGVEKLDLLGHSFGGLIACLYAIEFPGRVASLVLIAPAPMIVFPPASGGLYEEIRAYLPKEDIPAYDSWLADFFDYGKLFSRSEAELKVLNAGMTHFYRAAMEARGQSMGEVTGSDAELIGGWMMQAIFFGLGKRHDWSAAFARITVPTTVAFGSRDLSEAGSFDQYRIVPGALFRQVENADHFLVDDPAAFSEALSGIWR